MEPLLCPFCHNDVSTLYKPACLDEITQCPRCQVFITFTTDLSDVKILLANMVFNKGGRRHVYVGQDAASQIDVEISHIIDTLYDSAGEEKIGYVWMAAGWDPNELLSVSDVARILDVSPEEVNNLICSGAFPSVSCNNLRASWPTPQEPRIPRRNVKAAIGYHRGA